MIPIKNYNINKIQHSHFEVKRTIFSNILLGQLYLMLAFFML
jgi:hypothetical protein